MTDHDGSITRDDEVWEGISRELSALEAAHSIEVLLFIHDHEGCRKTAVYDALSHSTSIQSRMQELELVGLIAPSRKDGSHICRLFLTVSGRRLAESLRSFDDGSNGERAECQVR